MILWVNRDKRVKGRTCADGRKQRKKVVPGDANYPAVSTESVLITATIDMHEGSNDVICNIPGAFLSADMD